jgi:DnaJ-domain-containing protein 1
MKPVIEETERQNAEEQERLLEEARKRHQTRVDYQASSSASYGGWPPPLSVPIERTMSAMSKNHWKAADPFVCLHVPFGASKDTIKKQYRKLCLLYHPDKVRKG